MASHAHRDDGVFLNEKVNYNPAADIYGDRMQFAQLSFKSVQAKGRMKGIHFQKFQRLGILVLQIRMLLQKFPGNAQIRLRIDNFILHS